MTKPRTSARASNGLALIDAPWRHKYFDQPNDEGCFICRALAANKRQDSKNLILARGDLAVVMLNRYPYTMGALMIAPQAHVGDYRSIGDATQLEMTQWIKRGMTLLEASLGARAFNVGVNQGEAAGAGLRDHLHVHLVPRWGADTNFMSTVAGSRVLAQDVDSMYRRLRKWYRKPNVKNGE